MGREQVQPDKHALARTPRQPLLESVHQGVVDLVRRHELMCPRVSLDLVQRIVPHNRIVVARVVPLLETLHKTATRAESRLVDEGRGAQAGVAQLLGQGRRRERRL